MLSVPDICKPMNREALGWSTMVNALTFTIHAIRRRHNSFRLTYDENFRIKDAFATMRNGGKITHAPAREKHWVNSQLILKLSRGLLIDGIRHGVRDWSVLIQKCLALSLQSALTSRAGDITVSHLYDDKHCLRYRDIQLKVVRAQGDGQPALGMENVLRGDTLDDVVLQARITLMHEKNTKYDPSDNKVVAVSSLDDVQFNPVDAVKILLVHALRQGAVHGAVSVEDAIRVALCSRDGLIKWQFPHRPVLCAGTGTSLDFAKAAGVHWIRNALQEAAVLSGVSEHLTTHDIRRGAGGEASLLTPRRNLEQAADFLGHTTSARDRGTTREYMGHYTESTVEDRLNLTVKDSFAIVPVDTAAVAAPSKKRVSTEEIDEFLERPENASLLTLKKPRKAARLRVIAARNADHVEKLKEMEQRNATVVATFDASRSSLSTKDADWQGQPSADTWNLDVVQNDRVDSVLNTPDLTTAHSELFVAENGNEVSEAELTSPPQFVIDPQLLLESGESQNDDGSLNLLTNEAAVADMLLDQAVAHLLDGAAAEHTPVSDSTGGSNGDIVTVSSNAEIDKLAAPASDFLPWLSRINTTVAGEKRARKIDSFTHLYGGSRDPPTVFQVAQTAESLQMIKDKQDHRYELRRERWDKAGEKPCKNAAEGCSYTSKNPDNLKKHEQKCTVEKLQAATVPKHSEACDVGECGHVSYGATAAIARAHLVAHKDSKHAPKTLTCDIGGRPSCAELFSKASLANHKRGQHGPSIVPQKCTIDDCKSDRLFDSEAALKNHLRGFHGLRDQEVKNTLDKARKKTQGSALEGE